MKLTSTQTRNRIIGLVLLIIVTAIIVPMPATTMYTREGIKGMFSVSVDFLLSLMILLIPMIPNVTTLILHWIHVMSPTRLAKYINLEESYEISLTSTLYANIFLVIAAALILHNDSTPRTVSSIGVCFFIAFGSNIVTVVLRKICKTFKTNSKIVKMFTYFNGTISALFWSFFTSLRFREFFKGEYVSSNSLTGEVYIESFYYKVDKVSGSLASMIFITVTCVSMAIICILVNYYNSLKET